MAFKKWISALIFFFSFLPMSKAASTAYIANLGSSSLSVLDTTNNIITATIALPFSPYNAAVNPAGTRVYITDVIASTVSILQTSDDTIFDTIIYFTFPL